MSSTEQITRKIINIFEKTIESELTFEGSLDNINYYNLLCKAASKDSLYNISGNNVCMFNIEFDNTDSVLIIFSVPLYSEGDSQQVKRVSEKVINIISICEECFVTLDFTKSQEVEEEKFIYITIIKKRKK